MESSVTMVGGEHFFGNFKIPMKFSSFIIPQSNHVCRQATGATI